jgi:hypothetical protein
MRSVAAVGEYSSHDASKDYNQPLDAPFDHAFRSRLGSDRCLASRHVFHYLEQGGFGPCSQFWRILKEVTPSMSVNFDG